MYENLLNKKEKIAVVGLGYVGLPLANLFSKKYDVIGFDVNEEKIELYKQGIDVTEELEENALKNSNIFFTSDENELKKGSFYVVAVPTPINEDKNPDFRFIKSATETIARNIHPDSIVVYESTVYPGVTEDLCVPILEEISGLKCGIDFKVGYSPERINPGDKNNPIESITKIVSGMDEESLHTISKVYDTVLNNGVHEAPSIKVAEAAKIVENVTRDVNIALVNELAMIFNNMDINTTDVIEAAGTKWNFQKYYPGIVGGHCIGIDPYYLIFKSKKLHFNPKLMEISREINENLKDFIVKNIVYLMVENEIQIKGSNILVMGITFKENCNDIRNSKVVDILEELEKLGINLTVYDPHADKTEVKKEYDIDLTEEYHGKYDAILFAVAHDEFKSMTGDEFEKLSEKKPIIIDLKSMFNLKSLEYSYWSL